MSCVGACVWLPVPVSSACSCICVCVCVCVCGTCVCAKVCGMRVCVVCICCVYVYMRVCVGVVCMCVWVGVCVCVCAWVRACVVFRALTYLFSRPLVTSVTCLPSLDGHDKLCHIFSSRDPLQRYRMADKFHVELIAFMSTKKLL